MRVKIDSLIPLQVQGHQLGISDGNLRLDKNSTIVISRVMVVETGLDLYILSREVRCIM